MLAGGQGWSSWGRLASATRGGQGCRHGRMDESRRASALAGVHGQGGDENGDRRGWAVSSSPRLSAHSLLVPPELRGGDAHDRVDDTEPLAVRLH